jgi:toxin-antitoxin system PIN domain toxin
MSANHYVAQNWFTQARQDGWATCPLTENGFIRIVSSPAYFQLHFSTTQAIHALQTLIANNASSHHFWPDAVSLRDPALFAAARIVRHKQVTDAYLLGLCQTNNGALVTFDRRIDSSVIASPRADLLRVL